MDENKLVDYVYRRTKKQARIVPQPQPEPEPEPAPEPSKPEEEEQQPPAAATGAPEAEIKTEDGVAAQPEQGTDVALNSNTQQEDQQKPKSDMEQPTAEIDPSIVDVEQGEKRDQNIVRIEDHENMMNRMMYQYNYQYHQPLYVLQPIPPPPQLFSDENPNACCIV